MFHVWLFQVIALLSVARLGSRQSGPSPEGPKIFALTIGQSITHTIVLGLKTLAITIG